ncbi:TcdA/TcdB catalytic glycosyltransferase domain-containing protein, partial [Endozoicomonas sp. SESOKO3]|uniref:TcdA/TcdB catalytic glycosyltransferase domain-containing protein n=1 Tax=Endozoicomonas sp. SESOKO3 TaxID=2828744 RepID=UPI002147A836
RSEQWFFRRALDDSLDWLTAKNPDNPALENLGRLKKNDKAQQGEYDGLTETEQASLPGNTTSSVRGRFFTLTALNDRIGVYLTPDYLADATDQTIASDLRQLVDASDLFRRRVNNTDELRRQLGNATTPIRPDTLGDLHNLRLLQLPPDERNRTIPGDYVSLIIPGHDGAFPGGESGPMTYLPTRHGLKNDTTHDQAPGNRTDVATVNQTLNNGTFTLIDFDPGWGDTPYGSGWLSGHLSFFYQLGEALRLALGMAPEEDADAAKNRIRTDLGLPKHYPGQDGKPLPVVDPRQVMVKETLPIQVRFNQTTVTDNNTSVRLAVTGYGALGRHLELTAEPDGNGTYRLQLNSIGRMPTDDRFQPPSLRRYPEMPKPAARHRVRRADPDPDPAESPDPTLIDSLIPGSRTFQKEFVPLLRYQLAANEGLSQRFRILVAAFKKVDGIRSANAPLTFPLVLGLYDKLTTLIDKHPQATGEKFTKLAADIKSWLERSMKSVPARLHFVSVNPTDEELKRIRSWILANAESGLQINLWYDPNAMLASELAEALKRSVTTQLTRRSDPGNPSDFESDLLKELMRLQDEAWQAIESKMAQGQPFDQAVKDFLVEHLNDTTDLDDKKAQMLESYRQFTEQIKASYPRAKFSLKDINEVWTSAYGEEGQKASKYYFRELGLRGHQPAASALVKMRVMGTLGGAYSDTSLSPALNKDLFKGIDYSGVSETDLSRVKAVQTQLVIQGLGKEFRADDQDAAIKQKVSDDLAWLGKQYPRLKSDIEQRLASAAPSQRFEPLGKIKVIPGEIYLPSKNHPGLFFAATLGSTPVGNRAMELAINTLTSQYEMIDQFGLSELKNLNAANHKKTFLVSHDLSYTELVYYRFGGVSEFVEGHQILNGDLALKQSNTAMSRQGYDALLDALRFSAGERFTLSSKAAAARDQENTITRYFNTDPQKPGQYSQQLVIQMASGDDNPISKASRYLFRKYKNRQPTGDSYNSIRWLVMESGYWSDGETGARVNHADIRGFLDGDSRIHVVGLGQSGNGEFTLGGQTASDLSTKINELIGDTPVKTVNLIGSAIDHNGLVSQYLKDTLKATRTRTVTARDGLLRVDIWGRLWVGLLADTGLVTWSLDDRPDRLKAFRTSDGKVTVERLPEAPYVEADAGLRQMPSVLSQNSGLLGPVNPDNAIPTPEMFRLSLKSHLGALSSDDLESLEEKIAEFDRLRQEGSALKKYGLVYRMQENLPKILAGGAAVSHLAATINQYLLDALAEVPKNLHFIWIGRLNEGVKDYLKVWAKTNSWPLTLWYDPQSFLAPVLAREIHKAVAAEKIPESFLTAENASDEFVERVNQLQDLAYSTIKKGIAEGKTFDDMAKAFLVKHLAVDQSELETIQEESLKQFTEFTNEIARLQGNPESEKFRLADINTLWQPDDEASPKQWYVKELGLRGILAAASDLVRIELLIKNEGGVYLDVDTLPSHNDELFKHINIPQETSFKVKPDQLINHMIMEYFAEPGPEQLFSNRTPDPEIEKIFNEIKEEHPVFIKAIKEAIANHNDKPLFVFPESLRVIPGSVEFYLTYLGSTHCNNNLIIAPQDTEALKAVKQYIIRRHQLIERFNNDSSLKKSDTDIHKMAESIANEFDDYREVTYAVLNYRQDGILNQSRSTVFISGVQPFLTVSGRYLSDFFARKDLRHRELRQFFMQVNPLAKIDLVSEDTDESTRSWVPEADKTVRYALTAEHDSRYKNQIIIQLGNSENEAKASLYLKKKYQPDFSRLIRLKPDGTLIDTETSLDIKLEALQADFLKDDTRIIVVGHGSKVQGEEAGSNSFLLGGKTVGQLAEVLKHVTAGRFVHTVSVVGCGADASGEHYPVEDFARKLFAEIRTKRITIRNALVAVDVLGRKWTGTLPANGNVLWSQSDPRVKLVLEKDERGQLMARQVPVEEGLVTKLRDLPALPRGRDYVRLGPDDDRSFEQARRLLVSTFIENGGRQPLSELIEQYNRRLQQLTSDDFSPYRLMPLPVANAELPSAQAGAPRALHMSAFVRAESIGDPFSGVGLLAYGNRFAQENFFRAQQAGYDLAWQVTKPPSDGITALFTRQLLGSLQEIVAPGGNDINPFRVSSPDLMVSVLGKDDLSALYAHKRNDFSNLGQRYIKSLNELLGHFLGDKADQKAPKLNTLKRNEQRKSFQKSLSLGIDKRLKHPPYNTVSFTDPMSLANSEAFAGDNNQYLPVVTDPSGATYVLVDVPETNSAAFPDNLRNILFMLQSSGPLTEDTARTLINTIQSAYSHHSKYYLPEQWLIEKINRLTQVDLVTLATEINSVDTQYEIAPSLMRKLLFRLVSRAVMALESGRTPDMQEKLLIAELSSRLPDSNTMVVVLPPPESSERRVSLDPLLPFGQDIHSRSRITLGARSPFFFSTIEDRAYRSQLRELVQLGGMPEKLEAVIRYFDRPNELIDSLMAWRKWEIETGIKKKSPVLDLRLEHNRLIADSQVNVLQWELERPVIIQVGLSDVRPDSSDTRLARVIAQSYGMALFLQLRSDYAAPRDIVRAMEIWQTDYRDDPDGEYSFDKSLTLRQLPETRDQLYQTLILDSDDRDLQFARGDVDDFQHALEVLFREKNLARSVRNVFRHLAVEPMTFVDTFVEALVQVHTDFWKQMRDSELLSALQLKASDYRTLKKRLTNSRLPAKNRGRLLLDLGNMENPPDKTPYTGTIPSHYMDVYSKGIKENSPGIIIEVTPVSYGGQGSQSKIAILFPARLIKHALEKNAPSDYLFSVQNKIIKTLRWLRTTSDFRGFSNTLAKKRSQVFGNLQTLVNQGVIDGSAGTGFDQIKIPDSVRLLLVIIPPGSAATETPEPVLINNAGCVLKMDPGQYVTEGKMLVEQHHTLSNLIVRYVVASNLLKGVSSDSQSIRKRILHEFGVEELQKNIETSDIPVDTHKGRIGLEIEYDVTDVDAESRVELAYTKFPPGERISRIYTNMLVSTDSNKLRSIIEVITGPLALSVYLSESSALFRATNTMASALAKIPEGGSTVSDLVQAYNDELLGNDPNDQLKDFRLTSFNDFKNTKVSLLPEAIGVGSLPPHVQVNIGVELSMLWDITSYIPCLIAPRKSDILRDVFQLSQYKASLISETLNLNSDLLKSMLTIHLYKQALDSSTDKFYRGKIGTANTPITQLEGLLRLGTGDFLMTVISDLDATQLKSAIRDYSWQAFSSLMQQTVSELATMGSRAEGLGREWKVPEQKLEARLKLLFIDLLDYR